MDRHFLCTACGKCCYGQLPLTVSDAFAHADTFPLAMLWTPIRQGSKDFASVSRVGTTVKLPNNKLLAVLLVPTAYIPPAFPCPALQADNLCGLQANKPLRCRSMPFYPYRDEQYQAELLIPKKDWACDTSVAAPLVYQDKTIVLREDFDRERAALEQQQPDIQRYATYMLKYTPTLVNSLAKASSKAAGQVVTSLSSFLTATRQPDAQPIASQQVPVLQKYITHTAGKPALADYHREYTGWAKEMAYWSTRSPAA